MPPEGPRPGGAPKHGATQHLRRRSTRFPDKAVESPPRTRKRRLSGRQSETTGDGCRVEGNHCAAKCGRAASGTPFGIKLSWDSLREQC